MNDKVTSEELSERFAIIIDDAGKPIERTVPQMTKGEVLSALQLHEDEDARLRRVAEATDEAFAAEQKLARLKRLVRASLPDHPTMELRDAILEFWPYRKPRPLP